MMPSLRGFHPPWIAHGLGGLRPRLSLPLYLAEIADVSPPPVMVHRRKLLKLLGTDQNGIQEADGFDPVQLHRH
jgi:hypothetical protein